MSSITKRFVSYRKTSSFFLPQVVRSGSGRFSQYNARETVSFKPNRSPSSQYHRYKTFEAWTFEPGQTIRKPRVPTSSSTLLNAAGSEIDFHIWLVPTATTYWDRKQQIRMQSTAWDGSLVSLPSLNNSLISLPNSSRDTSPERTPHDLRHPLADALTTGETDSDASKSMNSSLNNNNSDSDPSNPLSPSPPLSSLPSPLSSSDLPPALLHLHAPSPHPLSAFLLSGLSPPNSPLSSVFSYSHDGSPGRGVGRWRRRRSSTNGSSARSTSGSGGGHSHNGGDTGGFVMPSMRLPQLEHGEHDSEFSGAASGGSGAEDGKLKVLVLGHGIAERKALERLLGERGGGGGDADLSMSMLSARLSERSNSNSNNHGGHDGLLDEFHSTTATFFHPSTDIEASELGGKLETKLEQLEKLLNPAYPSSQKLATLALSGLRGEMDCCLMLFSSRTSPSDNSDCRES